MIPRPLAALLAFVGLLVASAPSVAHADKDDVVSRADGLNDEGKELFSRGELDGAASKFRAAIALSPQARYYFNLCFLLNARGELDAALGACGEVGNAEGADDRIRKRTDALITSIEKKRAKQGANEKPDPDPDQPTEPEEPPPAVEDPNAPPPITTPPGGRPAYRSARPFTPMVVKQAPPKRFHIGVVAGLGTSSLEGAGLDNVRTGVTIGAWASTPLSRAIAAEFGAVYTQRGGSELFSFDRDDVEIKLDYLSFPLVAKFLVPLGALVKLHGETGLALSFLLGSETKINDIAAGDPSNSVDLGFLLGGGVTFHRQGGSAWVLNLRYERGLITVDEGLEINNRATTFLAGYAW